MNTIINDYFYVLTDRFGTIDVHPLNEKEFTIDHEIEDDGKYFYSKQFNGKITFNGVIFQRLRNIEKSIYICTEQELKIYRKCEGGNTLIFEGTFRLSDGAWDLDNCQVELSFSKATPDKCLTKNKSQKVNLLQEIWNRITVKSSTPSGTVEYKTCSQNSPGGTTSDYWCGTGDPYAQNWVLISYNERSPDGTHHFINNKWAREIVVLDCNMTAPPEWVLLEDNCATLGTRKYAKAVTTYDCVVTSYVDDNNPDIYTFTMDCKILGYEGNSSVIDNGMHLTDVLNVFMQKLCNNSFTVVSDFFQINPQNASATNYVTGLATQVNNLILFQKSDVKRPTSTGNASKAEWTFEKLMEALNKMFNVSYAIIGNVFRLEHISWFSRNAGLNLTLPRYAAYVNGLKKYTYKIESIPSSEVWQYKETRQEWIGDIDYTNACALGQDNTEKKYTLDEITADVQLCLANPSSDSNVVEDKGFVMIATTKFNNEYYIITESEGTGGNPALNNTLGFHRLVRKYHFHNRPLKNGKLNGTDVTFITTKPLKKGEKITVPLCCNDVFDPNDTVTTPLGVGVVDKATFNLASKTLELDLMYNVFESLTNNIPPVVAGANLTCYANDFIIFPINASDADGTIVSVQVAYPAWHGVVEILSTTQAKYTPTAGYVGWDFFHLKAFDDWAEVSNNAPFIVTVLPPNQPPVAADDNYNVFHGYPFTPYPYIFANDGDDNGFTLQTPNVVTAQGIAVAIDPATGNFSYTPPSGFEGVDTFQYTIVDNMGLTSTATVYLNVAYKNKPIAVNDNYNVMKNNQLVANGTNGKPKLTANDYTPDGLPYTYTCTAETKATTQGGSVTINTDGSFTYNPPANYTGQDSFDYTVHNPNGQDVGTAFIQVLPTIYVKMLISDPQNHGHVGDDEYYRTRDYTVYFYSDAGGTIPYNVTGLNFTVLINEHMVTSVNGDSNTYDYIWETSVLSGVSTKILDDFIWYEYFSGDPNQVNTQTFTKTLTLAAGAYVII